MPDVANDEIAHATGRVEGVDGEIADAGDLTSSPVNADHEFLLFLEVDEVGASWVTVEGAAAVHHGRDELGLSGLSEGGECPGLA
jgi:hypothetical protein